MIRTTPIEFASRFLFASALLTVAAPGQEEAPVSEATESCIFCHENLHPGIVAEWRNSRHAQITVARALEADESERRVSASEVPEQLKEVAIGCAECHTLNSASHPDSVAHGDEVIHPVVTPADCAVCHPVEVGEYAQNLMAHAYANLVDNPLYADLQDQINGVAEWSEGSLAHRSPHARAADDSCLSCHGTKVEVLGRETRDTGLGEMDFPVLSGWPNQGVGRINPDGTLGACTACHTRHGFSIAMARKPYTCSQCHKGPDVPAFKVYEVSKHGNLYKSLGDDWDFDAVPWQPGEHFSAPTCAACHISALATPAGDVVVRRTHRMNDRLEQRLFGLPYAHPHPLSPSTHGIRNAAGLALPTELTGEPVADAVIGAEEQAERRARMRSICSTCHAKSWIDGHFEQLDRTVVATNESTRTATAILQDAWARGLATGPATGGSPFDETLERMWVEHWLFYANSTRFAAAMMGADYGVFANGRFWLAKNLRDMATLTELQDEDR
jgi:hypothetical protein